MMEQLEIVKTISYRNCMVKMVFFLNSSRNTNFLELSYLNNSLSKSLNGMKINWFLSSSIIQTKFSKWTRNFINYAKLGLGLDKFLFKVNNKVVLNITVLLRWKDWSIRLNQPIMAWRNKHFIPFMFMNKSRNC